MSAYSIETFLAIRGDEVVVRTDFAVTGSVTGVDFRRSVKKLADDLNIRGWVANTRSGKVIGTLEGDHESIDSFKTWLVFVGPAKAVIEEVKFTNETWKKNYTLEEGSFNVVYDY